MTRQREYQKRHLKKGLCMKCSKKAVTKHYCDYHRKDANASALAYYYRKKERVNEVKSDENPQAKV